ncbi:cyclic nucleotide-binding domain-containing thioredoxin-disulfide reductase [Granulicella sp. S190]|uniref:FAD-dependent oxidoreductase n=1 Tax=Granulicella sp. S190 TaxID=1747226 RepID=UPI0020B11A84|nr:cyclic nucleotide-binding domain-containing thioredoxin-disulfide reductase [Granulicella sp. S190]
MEATNKDANEMLPTQSIEASSLEGITADFRRDLAFPKLTEEMVQRLKHYGREEAVPANVILYTHGDSQIDMFVILEGGIDVLLPALSGGTKIFARHRKFDFSGEFNLLNSQKAVVEARTICDSHLLRISRKEFQHLMRAEGDIANLVIQATIWRRIGIFGEASSGVVLRGKRGDAELIRLQRFFVRNSYPHRIVEVAPEAESGSVSDSMLPAVILPGGRVVAHPSITELADELGITELPDSEMTYDVAVVGAGPSGLASAVYAASEGLCAIVIEGTAPGGQAGTSSKIENYLGFPTGVSGQQLASRAQLQALKFGVHFAISRDTVTAEQIDGVHKLTLAGGIQVCARSVVVASGAQYRKLSVENYEQFENRGLYYAATAMESLLCREREVIVVGGGNSAGQAAVFLSGIAKHVYHIVRGGSLASTMSQYLISRIESSSRITLCTDSEIEKLEGDPSLECVTWTNRRTGETTVKPIGSVFVMIGAQPNSGWLFGTVKLDKKGFILTGHPHGFETTPYATSVPGMFAVGDVRANSVKRIASAVGEGSVVISDVHRYLADHRNSFSAQPNSALAALRAVRGQGEQQA